MSHRRRPSRQSPAATGRRHRPAYQIDTLEDRRLLDATGFFSDTGPRAMVATYTDGAGVPTNIFYTDVTFQAIFLTRQTSATLPPPQLTGPIPYPVPMFDTTAMITGADLFKVYVTSSRADSSIIISSYTPATTGAQTGDLTPYAGGAALGVENTAGVQATTLPGLGSALIGGGYFGPGLPNTSTGRLDLIDSVRLPTAFGLQPAPANGELQAGIEVVPFDAATGLQNDFGKFFVGGPVTGVVSFGGNLNEFYAGGLYTGASQGGDLAGQFGLTTSGRADAGNFNVGGDLRELLVGSTIGTDATALPSMYGNNDNDPARLNYVSDFDLTVGGTLGEVRAGLDLQVGGLQPSYFAGTVEVADSPLVSGQTPLAANVVGILGNRTDQAEFEGLGETLVPAATNDVFGEGEVNALDSTIADAQMLGSVPEVTATGALVRDTSGNLVYHAAVDGQLQGMPIGDENDYYGVAMLAGTTFTVGLANTDTGVPAKPTAGEVVYVFDPDGRQIASTVNANGGSIQVTADRPGIYHFEVLDSSIVNADFSYTLTIGNTGQVAIGGIYANGGYNDLGFDGGLSAAAGDIGALLATGTYYSLTDGPTPTAALPMAAASSIILGAGNLRAMVAGQIGEAALTGIDYEGVSVTANDTDYEAGPFFNIPDGSIGLIQTTAGLMDVNSQFDPTYLEVSRTNYVTDDANARAISGNIEVIDCFGSFEGLLATDAGIGTIRAADMNTGIASHFDVNADNVGNDGIIDLIDVQGQLGNLGAGGPSIITNTNGHVRYMQVTGEVYLPAAFGGLQDTPATTSVGAVARLTDDAGTVINVTPVGVTTTTTLVGPAAGTTSTGTANASSGSTANTSSGAVPVSTNPAPGVTLTTTTDPLTGAITAQTQTTGPQISILSYPEIGKGGAIPLSITSTGSMNITTTGADAEVDISSITIAGAGRPTAASGVDAFGNVTVDQPVPAAAANASGGATATSNSASSGVGVITSGATLVPSGLVPTGSGDPTDLFLQITGGGRVNVLNVQSVGAISDFVGAGATGADLTSTVPGTGTPVAIVNQTLGEIVNLTSPGVGTILVRGNLGFGTGEATPAAVLPRPVVAGGNDYPFTQQHTAVELTGDAVNIYAGGAVGNIISTGTVQTLVADYGNRPAAGTFAGIVGPVQATRLLVVEVGQGLASTGNGSTAQSGLFATDKIGLVTNAGIPQGDIRGNIVALGSGNTTNTSIDAIQLSGASIIGSRIANNTIATTAADAFSATSAVGGATLLLAEPAIPLSAGSAVTYEIGPITIAGNGGILGTRIDGASIAPIRVAPSGFGVINTELGGLSANRIGGITAGGYGVRGVTISNGGFVGPISATGNGGLVPVVAYGTDVRPSDIAGTTYDPFTGDPLTVDNDLNAALGGGTSFTNPNVANVTDTGVIEDLVVSAANDIDGISAQKVRTRLPLVATTGPTRNNVPVVGAVFDDSLTTGGNVGSINVRQSIDGLQVTAGSIGKFTQTGTVDRLGIDVAGAIQKFTLHGNLGGIVTDPATGAAVPDSYIYANGLSGHIDNLTVYGNLIATVFVSKYIGVLNVQGNIQGDVTVQGVAPNHLALTQLTVAGGILNGDLTINGNVGTIRTGGGLGVAGQLLTINGSLNRLIVGAGHAPSAALALDLTVLGSIQSMMVNGRITGSVHATGDVRKLQVVGNAANPNAIAGPIQIDGTLYNSTVTNGNVAANITAALGINTFTIRNGSLAAGAVLTASTGSIGTVRVSGGANSNIAGSIVAPAGTDLNLTTTGNVGDGVTPATISALSSRRITVRGSVLPGAVISIAGQLNSLAISGNLAAGATVAGHPILRHTVRGTTAGTLTVT